MSSRVETRVQNRTLREASEGRCEQRDGPALGNCAQALCASNELKDGSRTYALELDFA